jgi:hypothetical protein
LAISDAGSPQEIIDSCFLGLIKDTVKAQSAADPDNYRAKILIVKRDIAYLKRE